jgi:Peptidase family M28
MRSIAVIAGVLVVAGCTAGSPAPSISSRSPSPTTSSTPTATPSSAPSPSAIRPTARPTTTPTARQVRFDARRVQRDIRHLAGDIGPREATSKNYAEAADWVERRLEKLGYRVRRTTVRVPAGNSWGVPVRRGSTVNVIAEPAGFDRRAKHVVIGAHLDTVPQAPGAEDNGSGIAVLLELARLAASEPRVPVQFIAFGAEEPRGPGDALHHFGSRQLVADLPRAERRAVSGMVSLDRVGVGASYVPVCQGGPDGTELRSALRRAGRRADIPTRACENRTSDHWSYEKAGMPAVRIGSVPYAGYHSRGDVPSVVSRRQLDRVGRLVWEWLGSLR